MKLFVANLNYRATDDELKSMFEAVGSVESCKIVTDRDSGRSRGFGFVEMESDDDGQRAIDEVNGADFQGRQLVVRKAEDKR